MSEKNEAEIKKTEASVEQKPAPAPETNATPAKAEEVKPTNEQVENIKKQNLAFIKMRQNEKDKDRRIKELEAKLNASTSAPTAPATTPMASQTEATKPQEVAGGVDYSRIARDVLSEITRQQAAEIEAKKVREAQEKVIENLAGDSEISAIPGGVIEVLETIDNDPRLSRVNQIDPELAIREAKAMFKQKYNIGNASPPPKHPHTVGSLPGKMDLATIFAELDKAIPGTQRHRELVDLMNKAANKG